MRKPEALLPAKCSAHRAASRRYYRKHRKRILAELAAARPPREPLEPYYWRHREQISRRHKRYYRKKADHLRAYQAAYYEAHRERILAKAKERYQRNKRAS